MATTLKFNPSHNQLLLSQAHKVTEENRTERVSPILDKGRTKSGIDLQTINRFLGRSGGPISVLFRKCACNSSWCPVCGLKRLLPMLADIYEEWDWRHVRYFTLTVDREMYASPQDAYFAIQRKKELAEFMKRLKRRLAKAGEKIIDYFWLLEWHKDGWPHWHYYVLVDKPGKAGRINEKVNLTEAWGRARHVQEGYIKDEKHWRATVGYVAKHGYFADGKKEQAVLPDWARALPKEGPERIRIKRFEPKRGGLRNGLSRINPDDRPVTRAWLRDILQGFDAKIYNDESGEFEELFGEEQSRTWGEVLDSCGAECFMTIDYRLLFLTVRLKFPYRSAKKLPGRYVDGKGYIADLTVEQILWLLRKEEDIVCSSRRW